jgi:hypothetical protein
MMRRNVEVNCPDVVAELTQVFERYERALIANDVDTLLGLFRSGPETVRYGPADAQYGYDEIAVFRRSQPIAAPPRELRRTMITTFGADVGMVSTEFVPIGSDVIGRQSQTWLRTSEGWQIVGAHVSWLDVASP